MILPGDGIGIEVMNEVLNLIDWMTKKKSVSFDISERLVGGSAYDKEGDSISDETMNEALHADAVLFLSLIVINLFLNPSSRTAFGNLVYGKCGVACGIANGWL